MTPAERQQLLQRALRNAEEEREHQQRQRVPDGHPDPAEFLKRDLWKESFTAQPGATNAPERRVGTANGICSGRA
jgi:hypothetical protein